MKNHIHNSFLAVSLSFLLIGCGGSSSSSGSDFKNSNQKIDISKASITDDVKPDVVVNSAPTAKPESLTLADSADVYSGKLNGFDADGDKLKYEISSKPKYGNVEIHSDGYFTYRPSKNFSQSDSFTYIVKDDVSSCKPVKVTIKREKKRVEVPSSPSNLRLTALSPCRIAINWDDNSNNEDGFVIRKDGKLMMVAKANTTHLNICNGLKPDTKYKISVAAKNSAGESKSIEGYVKTKKQLTPPNAPSNLKAVSVGTTSVRLSWSDRSDNEEYFNLYINGEFFKRVSLNCNCLVIDSLKEGTTYSFEVEAVNGVGSSKSEILNITTKELPSDSNDTNSSDNEDNDTTSDNGGNDDTTTNSDQNSTTNQDDDQTSTTNDNSNDSGNVSDENSTSDSNTQSQGDDNNTSDVGDQNGDEDSNTTTEDNNNTTSTGDNNTTDENNQTSDNTGNDDTTNSDENNNTTPTDDNNTSDVGDQNSGEDNNTTGGDKETKSFDGPFAAIKELLQKSKDGEVTDVTYISVGDSTRADDSYYGGGELFDHVSEKLNEYGVNSILQAKAGHTARRWNDYEGVGRADNYLTWEDTVAQIPGDGNTTILNISLGINDARYIGSNEKEAIVFHLEEAIAKIKEQKPNTIILLTMPNRMVGDETLDGDGNQKEVVVHLEEESQKIREAYIELSSKYPMINTMDELFSGEVDMSNYRAEDESEYGEGVGIHLSPKAQEDVANLILSKILP
jgi:hypothetical protein